jgi:hypothetical protein
MLAVFVLTRFVVLDWDFYRSLAQALGHIRPALRLRRLEKEQSVRSDAEVARMLRRFYRVAPIRVYYQQSDVPEESSTDEGKLRIPRISR